MMGELMKEIVNGRTSNLFCIPEPYRNVKFTVLKHLVRRMFVFTPNLKGYYCTTLYSTGTAELRNCAFGRSRERERVREIQVPSFCLTCNHFFTPVGNSLHQRSHLFPSLDHPGSSLRPRSF